MNNLHHTILTKIKAGNVAMKPRWHFVLMTVLTGLGALMAGLLLIYIVSFVGYIVRLSGATTVSTFGSGGLVALLLSVPWLLIALALIFVVVLEILVQRFSFGYQKPLLYSVLGVIILTSLGSYVVLKTPLHQSVLQLAHQGGVPVVGPLYRSYEEKRLKDVTVGVVQRITSDQFEFVDRTGALLTVTFTAETRGLSDFALATGSAVVVLGERADGQIIARGVREAPADVRSAHDRRSRPESGRPDRPTR